MSISPPLGGERILIVDDEPQIREPIMAFLADEGFACDACGSGEDGQRALETRSYALVLTDLRMPGLDGIGLIRQGRALAPDTCFILMTAYATLTGAVDALRAGAVDFLMKPVVFEDLAQRVRRILEHRRLHAENARLRELLFRQAPEAGLIGESAALRQVRELVARFAPADRPVLVTGESGTGKELVARALHASSPRAKGPFLAVNCAALPENLLESELFGYRRGAFTGADRDREGLFSLSSGGTLFLDEVGDLPRGIQAKLLRAVEEREVLPLGGDRPRPVDVRIVAAMNRDPQQAVASGAMREDLLFRLNVLSIHVPPLRERRDDIPALVRHFVAKHARELNSPVREVPRPVLDAMVVREWRGNVRELENAVQRLLVLANGTELPAVPWTRETPAAGSRGDGGQVLGEAGLEPGDTLRVAVSRFERRLVERMIVECRGDKVDAARRLGISIASLYAKRRGVGEPGPSTASDGEA